MDKTEAATTAGLRVAAGPDGPYCGWYNFDPSGYLECGVAGSLGGWDEDDGVRKPVPGPVVPLVPEPEPGERSVAAVGGAELAELARCGQEYE